MAKHVDKMANRLKPTTENVAHETTKDHRDAIRELWEHMLRIEEGGPRNAKGKRKQEARPLHARKGPQPCWEASNVSLDAQTWLNGSRVPQGPMSRRLGAAPAQQQGQVAIPGPLGSPDDHSGCSGGGMMLLGKAARCARGAHSGGGALRLAGFPGTPDPSRALGREVHGVGGRGPPAGDVEPLLTWRCSVSPRPAMRSSRRRALRPSASPSGSVGGRLASELQAVLRLVGCTTGRSHCNVEALGERSVAFGRITKCCCRRKCSRGGGQG